MDRMDERDAHGKPVLISSASVRVERTPREVRTVGDLKRYVDGQGRMRSLTEKDAQRLGGYTLAGEDQQDKRDAPAGETVDATQEQATQDETGSAGAKARTAIEGAEATPATASTAAGGDGGPSVPRRPGAKPS